MGEATYLSRRQIAKQPRHVQRHAYAMMANGKAEEIRWVSLPPHHDLHHPRGFLVGSTPARPRLRIDLGLERTFPSAAKTPNDHYFMEMTVVSHRKGGKGRVLELIQPRTELSHGLRPILKDIVKKLDYSAERI